MGGNDAIKNALKEVLTEEEYKFSQELGNMHYLVPALLLAKILKEIRK